MLKIKDNVEEQLLKASYGKFIIKKKYNEDTGKVCKIELRNLFTNTLICYFIVDEEENGDIQYAYPPISNYENILYDLIKADLVEKVSDEE